MSLYKLVVISGCYRYNQAVGSSKMVARYKRHRIADSNNLQLERPDMKLFHQWIAATYTKKMNPHLKWKPHGVSIIESGTDGYGRRLMQLV